MIPPKLVELIQNKGALVISGSRSLENRDNFALFAVDEAIKRDFWIIVGDARGIDTLVWRAVVQRDYHKMIAVGCEVNGGLRSREGILDKITWLVQGGNISGSCYVIRDKAMAQLASKAPANGFLGLCHNHSRGTRHTFEACKQFGIPGILYHTDGSKEVCK
jgi:hypothetical protein